MLVTGTVVYILTPPGSAAMATKPKGVAGQNIPSRTGGADASDRAGSSEYRDSNAPRGTGGNASEETGRDKEPATDTSNTAAPSSSADQRRPPVTILDFRDSAAKTGEPSIGDAPQRNAPSEKVAAGSMTTGGISASGGSVANASAVVAGMQAGFRRCYDRGLAENPDMQGSLRFTAKIGPSGEVLSVSPSGGAGLSDTVISCVSARIASAKFAPPEGGGATLVIPISFVRD